MQAEHWVTIAVALMGLIGVLAGVFFGRKGGDVSPERKAAEDHAVDTTHTPASPGTGMHDAEAMDLARLAMNKANKLSARLTVVEEELNIVQRSYNAAYWWIQWVRGPAWDEIRENVNPPAEPQDIHHPK